MKKSKKKKNNKGFTLVELLAVIAILSVVLSLTVYISLDVVKSAREKSYEATINNIEKNANTYVAENANKIFYLTNGNIEYQCITVNDLIEMGYLKTNVVNSPVSSDKKVNENDYIYIERDKSTKALLKTIYDNKTGYMTSCSTATSAVGDIVFTLNPDINKWSRSKDITITYKLRNYQDVDARNYQYTYTIDSNSQQNVLENRKVLSLNKPTTINAKIVDNTGKTLVHKTISISKIDIVGPTIETNVNSTAQYISNEVTIPVRIKDSESGVNYKTVSKDDFKVIIDTTTLDTSKYTFSGSLGNYSLKITDSTNRGNLIIKVDKDKVFDNVSNGNEETTLNPNIVMNQVFKVTASANGGTISTTTGWTGTGTSATKNVTYGNTYGTLPTVTRTGYTFNGWYTLASGGTKIESTTKVTTASNHTIYARWTANSYTVTASANGGSITSTSGWTGTGTSAKKSVTYDGTYGTLPTVARTGYTFNGWYTAASGGTKVESTTKVAITANQTLYAHWTANSYTVTASANGGSITATSGWNGTGSTATKSVTYDGTYGILPTVARTGYTFNGWYTAASGGTKVESTTKVAITANQTLYAHWTVSNCILNFDINTTRTDVISLSPTTATVAYGNAYGNLKEPTNSMYGSAPGTTVLVFVGWWSDPANGTQATSTTKCTTPGTIQLYAHWINVVVPLPYVIQVVTAQAQVDSCKVSASAALACMKANSEAWWSAKAAGDTEKMESLHQANEVLSQIASSESYYEEAGNWYSADGTLLYDVNGSGKTSPISIGGSIPYSSSYYGSRFSKTTPNTKPTSKNISTKPPV